ncbi:hypothetical protein D2V08_03385 [Flagellimonas lutimaris]|uniref:Uncharacterized protein n=1 Tax=Flagellimonas lutimaris TaxID=475082 RepID=A0A3A1N9X9_9FLAO|nr:hypothetical protein [Allomuricauda lutimaris]RIV36002.1 hypothetical protein D2V08_03385 [Allomuricauda lutimaris]
MKKSTKSLTFPFLFSYVKPDSDRNSPSYRQKAVLKNRNTFIKVGAQPKIIEEEKTECSG